MKHKYYLYTSYFLLTLGLLFLLSGCKSSEMNAMEETASMMDLKTGHEVNRWQEDKGITLGKPVYAKLMLDYEPVNNFTKEEVYDEIVATLEKNNWEKDESNIVPESFIATLQHDRFEITASVWLPPDENLVKLYLIVH